MTMKNLSKHSHQTPKTKAWVPFYKMHNEIDNMFNDFLSDTLWSKEDSLTPKSDIIETKNEYKILMDMPGVEEKDIEISLDNKVLKITGKKDHSEETKDATSHTIEREYGNFSKILQLPDNASHKDIKAKFKNGVLKLTIPKTEEAKQGVKKITISK